MKRKEIQKLAQKNKINQNDLIALAPRNDPFLVGSPAQLRDAHWFADIFNKHFKGHKTHIRDIHYICVSSIQPTYKILKKDPKTKKTELVERKYVGSAKDWTYILTASKYARYLGLIPYDAVIDRKNEYTINVHTWLDDTFDEALDNVSEDSFKELITDQFTNMINIHTKMGTIMEIWIEKSGQERILDPICSHYGVNLVTCEGETSITMAARLIESISTYYDYGVKRFIVLYISDFDPAGRSMPKAFARKIEYMVDNALKEEKGIDDIEIMIDLVAVTAEQVRQYNLPTAPIDDKKLESLSYLKRTQKFYDLYGVRGIVELQALEALHPNSLKNLIEQRVNIYHDANVYDYIQETHNTTVEKVEEALEVVNFKEVFDLIFDNVDFTEPREYFEDRTEDIPETVIDTDLEKKIFYLYDSKRDYVNQIQAYNEYDNGKETKTEDLQ